MTRDMPSMNGAPVGWVAFGRHVDDGMGIASSAAVVNFILDQLRSDWTITSSGWDKLLGYSCVLTEDDDSCVIQLHCLPYLKQLAAAHTAGESVYNPKLPCTQTLLLTKAGELPPADSPDRPAFEKMQSNFSSGVGSTIWAMRVHDKLVFPTTWLCSLMSNPSHQAYKLWKQSVLHEVAFPRPLEFGGHGRRPLQVDLNVDLPFGGGKPICGLHMFTDSNLGSPRPYDDVECKAIAHGTARANPPAMGRSITGGIICAGGGSIATVCQRQHNIAPDSTAAEITACGTMLNKLVPIAGLFAELRLPSLRAIPVFVDSQSMIFVANDQAAVKRSVWILRRSAVLREFVDQQVVEFFKVGDPENVANLLTKPLTLEKLNKYLSYLKPASPTSYLQGIVLTACSSRICFD